MAEREARRSHRAILVSLVAMTTPFASAAQHVPPPRQIIRTQDDLPRHVYPVPGTAETLLAANDQTFDVFAAKVAADADAVLSRYEITDRATRRRLLTTRSSYEMLAGQNMRALATILEIRQLEDKPDAKLTSGLREEAILRARIATGRTSGAAFERRFAALYRGALTALPFSIVGTRLKETKSRIETRSPAIVSGYIASQVEPAIAREHAVTDKGADDLLWARTYRRILAPTASASIAVLRDVIAANTVERPDIWPDREVTLTVQDAAHPVAVAIWDSGIDVALFPGRLLDTPASVAGLPGNGYGISFDIDSRPTTGVLKPLTSAERAQYPVMLADMQGFDDSDAAIDSAAAERLRAKLFTMTTEESAAFLERIRHFGDYAHGTHIAGIVARGNPFVRLAVVRDTYDARAVPAPPTDASVARRVALFAGVSAWLKANRIRIVNMSWGDTPGDYEAALEKNGMGGTAADRKATARRYFETARAAFRQILADNPDTLFVGTAGNSNADTGFEQGYPSSLAAPNLLIVSAVDQAGEETGFTSNGANVAVSANGYRVRSYVPGGTEALKSGTSMAAPNVVNLAAKLIALNPELTPPQAASLIRRGATTSADGRRHIINPKASVALMRTPVM